MARNRNRSVFSQGSTGGAGRGLTRAVLVLALLVLVAGAAFLGFTDWKPPSTQVEKVIPDSRLPQ